MASQSPLLPILLCSDFPMFRESLQAHFERAGGFKFVACENDRTEMLALVASLQPKLLLLDLNIPLGVICELLDSIRSVSPMPILVMTDSLDNSSLIETLQHGAQGVVSRRTTPALLTKSIQTVLSGDYWVSRGIVSDLMHLLRSGASIDDGRRNTLEFPANQSDALKSAAGLVVVPGDSEPDAARFVLTSRELQVIEALVDGQTNKDIAATLGISQHTVKHHLTNIFDKLGVYNRVELVLYAINGRLSPAPLGA